jgi:hypothetical protein
MTTITPATFFPCEVGVLREKTTVGLGEPPLLTRLYIGDRVCISVIATAAWLRTFCLMSPAGWLRSWSVWPMSRRRWADGGLLVAV